jgi:hypothetical protein
VASNVHGGPQVAVLEGLVGGCRPLRPLMRNRLLGSTAMLARRELANGARTEPGAPTRATPSAKVLPRSTGPANNGADLLAAGRRSLCSELRGVHYMCLRESLEAVAEISPEAFADLRRDIDPEWVVQALEATGTARLRTRRAGASCNADRLARNRSI